MKHQDEIENGDAEKKRLYDRKMAYDNYVREMHWPKVSEKKRKELEMVKESIKPSPLKPMKASELRQSKDTRSTYDL